MNRRLNLIYVFSLFLLSFYGCQAENENSSSFPKEDDMVSFSLNISSASTDITRSISEDNERTIETIDILAFDATSDEFTYHVTGTVTAGATTATQNVEANVQCGDNQRFVFLINARGAFTTPEVGDDRETVLKDILLSLSEGNGWNAASGSNYTALPMWGTIDLDIPTGGLSTTPEVDLYRSVARIEVINNASNFDLTGVYLYRSNLSGRVAPANSKTNEVSLPDNVGTADDDHPVVYDVTGNTLLQRSIYTFERENKDGNKDNVACLVLKGIYDNETTYFYRVDFFKDGNYLDLIRNYSYTLTITNVKDTGYDDEKKALNGEPMLIEGNIQWTPDNLILNIGQYYLGVNKHYLEFESPAVINDNKLVVRTNHPDGWEIVRETPQPWLSLDKTEGEATAGEEVPLTLDANPGLERSETFTVKAGEMAFPVTVTQKPSFKIVIASNDPNYDSSTEVLYLLGANATGTLYAKLLTENGNEPTESQSVRWEIDNKLYAEITSSSYTYKSNYTNQDMSFSVVRCGEVIIRAIATLENGTKTTATAKIVVDVPMEKLGIAGSYDDDPYIYETEWRTGGGGGAVSGRFAVEPYPSNCCRGNLEQCKIVLSGPAMDYVHVNGAKFYIERDYYGLISSTNMKFVGRYVFKYNLPIGTITQLYVSITTPDGRFTRKMQFNITAVK